MSTAEQSRIYRLRATDKTRAAGKRWRDSNPEKIVAKYERHIARYLSFKDKPCADCGNSFPLECMDFDHREGVTKIGHVAHMIRQHKGHEVIMAEIEKCDIICANCHRTRTRDRYMTARAKRLSATKEMMSYE